MENFCDGDLETDTDFESTLNERSGTPVELIEAATKASYDLLPAKSKKRYDGVYAKFKKWKASKGASSNSERVLISYFDENAEKYAPTSLWSEHSMLKATLNIYDMLKKKAKGFVPKKAKIFTETEIKNFIDNAPDVMWLDVKVTCIFSICGACRTHELPTIKFDDIKRYDDMYYVTVAADNTKTGVANSFAITGSFLNMVRRYESLRSAHATSDRFFLNYQRGKCTVQVIGHNKFCKMPGRIAKYLHLPNPELYTGHSFRRTSATVYANSGATIEALKRHTGHKSTKVCESYVVDSEGYKKKTADVILSSINCTSTLTSNDSLESATGSNVSLCNSASGSGCHNKVVVVTDDNINESSDPIASSVKMHPLQIHENPCVNGGTDFSNFDKRTSCADIDCDVDTSQSIVQTQNFMSRMDKRFAFYKCDNLTINYNPK